MNKKLLAISLIAGLSTVLNAEGFDTKVYVGATAAKMDSETYTQYNLGYTANNYLNNGIILGFGNSLGYGNVKNGVEVITVDMDLKAGHEIIQNLNEIHIGYLTFHLIPLFLVCLTKRLILNSSLCRVRKITPYFGSNWNLLGLIV